MKRISNLSAARFHRSRGHLLIELIVVVAVIAILGAVYYGGWLSPASSDRVDGEGKTIIGRSALKARDMECQNYLGQVRASISMQKIDDIVPQSLTELNLPAKLLACPIGHEAYQYDAATQKVKCPHPGHEDF